MQFLHPPQSLAGFCLQAAFSAFLSAAPSQALIDIQRGAAEQPREVAAAQPPAPPRHDWLLADQAVRQGAAAGGIKVRTLAAAVAVVPLAGGKGLLISRTIHPPHPQLRTRPTTCSPLACGTAPRPHTLLYRPSQVLSVDDDPVNQMVVQNTLAKAGLSVLKAADGQKALDMLQVGLFGRWGWGGRGVTAIGTLEGPF